MEKTTKRSFLKTAATVGGAAAVSAQTAKTETAQARTAQAKRLQYKRKSPSSVELIEVGVITCAYYSHIEGIWGPFMNPPLTEFRGVYWPRTTGMVMTMVWDPDTKAAENFAKTYDVKVVKNYYDMVDKVNAVILSDFYATGWWPQLSKPYLEAGIQTLINRPFALSLREAHEMLERSKQYNAPILVPSTDETMHENMLLKHKFRKLLDEGAYVVGVLATEPTTEYPAHGLHSIYGIHYVLEPTVKAVSLVGDTWWEFDSAFMTWRCSQADHPDYYVGLQFANEPYSFGSIIITTNKARISTDHEITRGEDWPLLRSAFVPTMLEFARMVETRTMPQSHDYILKKTTTFLTGLYSHCEKNGAMVNCADLPMDWRAPEKMPDRIPKGIFR